MLFKETVSRGYIEPCPSSSGEEGVLVIVDAPSCGRASIDCTGYEAVYLIDHHIPQEPLGIYRGVVEPSASSTTELCVLMLEEVSIDIPSSWLANLLLSGILFDTRGLSMASIASIEAVRFLMMRGARISDALQMIRRAPEISERIARVKAMSRVRAYRAGGIIVCITHVGAYEASAAQILIGVGCDLALVISERSDSMRIVARCSEDLCRNRGLDEIILSDLTRIYGGGWGGHRQAAVASIKSPGGFEEILGRILEILRGKLGERLRPLDSG
jgi:nanoRNase/pAp phosphatase (c-di-AMP/oligoRNAs hydrolase)